MLVCDCAGVEACMGRSCGAVGLMNFHAAPLQDAQQVSTVRAVCIALRRALYFLPAISHDAEERASREEQQRQQQ